MKRTAVFALLIAAHLAPQSMAQNTPETVADLDYAAFQQAQLLKWEKTFSEMTNREQQQYTEARAMGRRRHALAFLAAHPDDPRRWDIVNALTARSPRFVLDWGVDDADGEPHPVFDEDAARAWRIKISQLKSAMETAADLPERLRGDVADQIRWKKAYEAFYARWRSGEMAPDFPTHDPAGKEVKLSDYRGKVVVLDFWATWCGPCLQGMPHTQALAARYKNQGVVVLASTTRDTRENFERFVTRNRQKYPDIVWTHDRMERDDACRSNALYGVPEIPAQFIIDRNGRVVDVVLGYHKGEVIVDAMLAKAGIQVDPDVIAQAAQDLKNRGR